MVMAMTTSVTAGPVRSRVIGPGGTAYWLSAALAVVAAAGSLTFTVPAVLRGTAASSIEQASAGTPASRTTSAVPRADPFITEFSTGTVQAPGEAAAEGRLVSYDEREVPFDLAVIVPLHAGAGCVGRSPGLGDELDFVPVDRSNRIDRSK